MMEPYMRTKKFRAKYRFTNIFCYVPKRYGVMGSRQWYQRTVIDDFKNGHYDDTLCQRFEQIIKAIITHKTNMTSWVITFVPPSIGYEVEYDWRYRHLAQYLKDHLPDVPIIYYGISVSHEYSWQQKCKGGRRTIKPGNLIVDQQSFREKSVILIDDVITTGYSFRTVGDALMAAGATYVTGVVLAMTIHPHQGNQHNNNKKYNPINYSRYRDSSSKRKSTNTLPFPDVTNTPEQGKRKPFSLPFPEVATSDQLRDYQTMIVNETGTAIPADKDDVNNTSNKDNTTNTSNNIPENSDPNVKPH